MIYRYTFSILTNMQSLSQTAHEVCDTLNLLYSGKSGRLSTVGVPVAEVTFYNDCILDNRQLKMITDSVVYRFREERNYMPIHAGPVNRYEEE